MKQLTFLVVAILSGFAASVPAQIKIDARLARNIVGSISIGASHGHDRHSRHDHHQHRQPPACEPVRRAPIRFRNEPRGHWQTVCEEVLVPGFWREEHVPPTYGWVYDSCGHRHWQVVREGGCQRIWVPARWETRSRRVWVAC